MFSLNHMTYSSVMTQIFRDKLKQLSHEVDEEKSWLRNYLPLLRLLLSFNHRTFSNQYQRTSVLKFLFRSCSTIATNINQCYKFHWHSDITATYACMNRTLIHVKYFSCQMWAGPESPPFWFPMRPCAITRRPACVTRSRGQVTARAPLSLCL